MPGVDRPLESLLRPGDIAPPLTEYPEVDRRLRGLVGMPGVDRQLIGPLRPGEVVPILTKDP
jgi:hypothetical protein